MQEQYSPGAGGASGVRARTDLCAVEGCEKRARPQLCPYDGRYHGHGAIHYDCGHPKSQLQFRKGGWFWVCDEHYTVLVKEREAAYPQD